MCSIRLLIGQPTRESTAICLPCSVFRFSEERSKCQFMIFPFLTQ